MILYRGFHEKGTFSVHSFNDDYLSIPERPGSYKYLFHEIPVSSPEKQESYCDDQFHGTL